MAYSRSAGMAVIVSGGIYLTLSWMVKFAAKGQAVVAFVTLKQPKKPTPELREKLRADVAKVIGGIAKPDDIRITDALPKTRSGKIMRRLLKEVASSGQVTGDTTTLDIPKPHHQEGPK